MRMHTSAVLLIAAGFLIVAAQTSDDEAKRKARIVFTGTVERIGAATFAGVPESARNAIVRVESIVTKPPAIVLAPKDMVTVEVKDPNAFRIGARVTFYTESWIMGGKGSLALREVAHESPASLPKPAIATASVQITEPELRTRLAAVEVVAEGRVMSVRPALAPATAGASPRRITEHEPDWQEAIVHVESALKGTTNGQNLVVRFPGSNDVAWRNYPKLRVGDRSVFLLDKDQISGNPKATLNNREVDAHTVADLKSVLPVSSMRRIRALSK